MNTVFIHLNIFSILTLLVFVIPKQIRELSRGGRLTKLRLFLIATSGFVVTSSLISLTYRYCLASIACDGAVVSLFASFTNILIRFIAAVLLAYFYNKDN